MAGAFLKVSQLATIESLHVAIRDEVPVKIDANIAASSRAYADMDFGQDRLKEGVAFG
jgi:hypothetical protein